MKASAPFVEPQTLEEGSRFSSCLHELAHIRMPNGRFEQRNGHLERSSRMAGKLIDCKKEIGIFVKEAP
jgi:hypothetical protein